MKINFINKSVPFGNIFDAFLGSSRLAPPYSPSAESKRSRSTYARNGRKGTRSSPEK